MIAEHFVPSSLHSCGVYSDVNLMCKIVNGCYSIIVLLVLPRIVSVVQIERVYIRVEDRQVFLVGTPWDRVRVECDIEQNYPINMVASVSNFKQYKSWMKHIMLRNY